MEDRFNALSGLRMLVMEFAEWIQRGPETPNCHHANGSCFPSILWPDWLAFPGWNGSSPSGLPNNLLDTSYGTYP